MNRNPVYKLLWAYALGVVIILIVLVLTAKRCNGQDSTQTIFLFPVGDPGIDCGNIPAIIDSPKTFELKKHIVPASLVFVSGAFEGVMDYLQFRYDKGNDYWNPDISWVRKYKNKDPNQGKTFAGKYLVWTTDGWHLMKFGRNLTMFAGITLKFTEQKKKWYWYIIEGVAYWSINRIGFNITYNLLPDK